MSLPVACGHLGGTRQKHLGEGFKLCPGGPASSPESQSGDWAPRWSLSGEGGGLVSSVPGPGVHRPAQGAVSLTGGFGVQGTRLFLSSSQLPQHTLPQHTPVPRVWSRVRREKAFGKSSSAPGRGTLGRGASAVTECNCCHHQETEEAGRRSQSTRTPSACICSSAACTLPFATCKQAAWSSLNPGEADGLAGETESLHGRQLKETLRENEMSWRHGQGDTCGGKLGTGELPWGRLNVSRQTQRTRRI